VSPILTVGHSTLPVEEFLELLREGGVRQVADVRRFPGSRRHPQYGADALSGALAEHGIAYEHFGALGGRRPVTAGSCNDGWRVAGFRGYADHLRTAEFADGLARLEDLAARSRVAVMCAEAQWWRCHRRLLADVLGLRGWEVGHLMTGGRLVDHRPPDFMVAGRHASSPTRSSVASCPQCSASSSATPPSRASTPTGSCTPAGRRSSIC
jgi:uncharacterized protein (DUF488 family)